MSRAVVRTADGHTVVFGYDRPFATWFAQLWAPDQDPDTVGSPVAAVGYHEAERALDSAPRYGPCPIASPERLVEYCREQWGVSLEEALVRMGEMS